MDRMKRKRLMVLTQGCLMEMMSLMSAAITTIAEK